MFRRKPAEPSLPPEWLIVGLGNPGPEYQRTRHNVGFDLIDKLAEGARAKLPTRRHRAVYGPATVADRPVVLAKPLTFMNLSGQAVKPLLGELSLKPDRLIVIADDLDLPLGKIRLRAQGSAGGHNGHKSLIQSLGTQDYIRLKIGIGKGEETVDHVLSRFTPEERVDIDRALKIAADAIACVISEGVERAMGQFNGA